MAAIPPHKSPEFSLYVQQAEDYLEICWGTEEWVLVENEEERSSWDLVFYRNTALEDRQIIPIQLAPRLEAAPELPLVPYRPREIIPAPTADAPQLIFPVLRLDGTPIAPETLTPAQTRALVRTRMYTALVPAQANTLTAERAVAFNTYLGGLNAQLAEFLRAIELPIRENRIVAIEAFVDQLNLVNPTQTETHTLGTRLIQQLRDHNARIAQKKTDSRLDRLEQAYNEGVARQQEEISRVDRLTTQLAELRVSADAKAGAIQALQQELREAKLAANQTVATLSKELDELKTRDGLQASKFAEMEKALKVAQDALARQAEQIEVLNTPPAARAADAPNPLEGRAGFGFGAFAPLEIPVAPPVALTPATQAQVNQAVYTAAEKGDLDALVAALAAGANVNMTGPDGSTPLLIASRRGHANCVTHLLDAGARIDSKGMHDWPPLFGAAYLGHTDCVRALVSRGADVNIVTTQNQVSPLLGAVAKGHVECVAILLEAGANPLLSDVNGRLPKQAVHATKNTAAIKAHLAGAIASAARAADAQAQANQAVYTAAEKGDLDALVAALAAGANVNMTGPDGSTPLLIASRRGHANCVTHLLDAGARIDSKGMHDWPPLFGAAYLGHTDCVRALVSRGADVNIVTTQNQVSPLLGAVAKGHVECVAILLEAGANPLLSDVNGRLPKQAVHATKNTAAIKAHLAGAIASAATAAGAPKGESEATATTT